MLHGYKGRKNRSFSDYAFNLAFRIIPLGKNQHCGRIVELLNS